MLVNKKRDYEKNENNSRSGPGVIFVFFVIPLYPSARPTITKPIVGPVDPLGIFSSNTTCSLSFLTTLGRPSRSLTRTRHQTDGWPVPVTMRLNLYKSSFFN